MTRRDPRAGQGLLLTGEEGAGSRTQPGTSSSPLAGSCHLKKLLTELTGDASNHKRLSTRLGKKLLGWGRKHPGQS